MDIRRIVSRRIRSGRAGVDTVGDVHAVIAANVDEPRSRSAASKAGRSMPQKTVRRGDLEEDPAEERREDRAPIDADVEADVNAAVPDDDEPDEATEATDDERP